MSGMGLEVKDTVWASAPSLPEPEASGSSGQLPLSACRARGEDLVQGRTVSPLSGWLLRSSSMSRQFYFEQSVLTPFTVWSLRQDRSLYWPFQIMGCGASIVEAVG